MLWFLSVEAVACLEAAFEEEACTRAVLFVNWAADLSSETANGTTFPLGKCNVPCILNDTA